MKFLLAATLFFIFSLDVYSTPICQSELAEFNNYCNPTAPPVAGFSCKQIFDLASAPNALPNSGPCTTNNDCLSGVCMVNVVTDPVTGAIISENNECDPLPNTRALYLDNHPPTLSIDQNQCILNQTDSCEQTVPITGAGTGNPDNSKCCSRSCNSTTLKCDPTFKQVKILNHEDDLCGFAECGTVSMPDPMNASAPPTDVQLIPLNGQCGISPLVPPPSDTSLIGLNPQNLMGTQCEIRMLPTAPGQTEAQLNEEITNFDGYIKGFEYATASHEINGSYNDHMRQLSRLRNAGIALQSGRKAVQEIFETKRTNILQQLQTYQDNPEQDPVKAASIRAIADLVRAQAEKDLAIADVYSDFQKDADGNFVIDADGNYIEQGGVRAQVKVVANKAENHNYRCRRWFSGGSLTKPCLGGCNSGFLSIGKRDKHCARICRPMTLPNGQIQRNVDPLWPKNLRPGVAGLSFNPADIVLDFAAYASEHKINAVADYGNLSEYNPFGVNGERLMSLADIGAKANMFLTDYNYGGIASAFEISTNNYRCRLASHRKAFILNQVEQYLHKLSDYKVMVAQLRFAQANCLEASALAREERTEIDTSFDNSSGDSLAPNNYSGDQPTAGVSESNLANADFSGAEFAGLAALPELAGLVNNNDKDKKGNSANSTLSTGNTGNIRGVRSSGALGKSLKKTKKEIKDLKKKFGKKKSSSILALTKTYGKKAAAVKASKDMLKEFAKNGKLAKAAGKQPASVKKKPAKAKKEKPVSAPTFPPPTNFNNPVYDNDEDEVAVEKNLTGLSESEINRIRKGQRSKKYLSDESKDSLFMLVSKTYVRAAYPAIFKKKKKKLKKANQDKMKEKTANDKKPTK